MGLWDIKQSLEQEGSAKPGVFYYLKDDFSLKKETKETNKEKPRIEKISQDAPTVGLALSPCQPRNEIGKHTQIIAKGGGNKVSI